MKTKLTTLFLLTLALAFTACNKSDSSGNGSGGKSSLTIGVAFETLQTEGWVAAWDRIKEECPKHGITMLEAVADGDANKQFEQVKNFINRKVDGIIIAPKDSKTVIPMIKAANAANIPVVLYNRPADATDAKHTVIAPDNVSITKATVDYLVALAKKSGRKQKTMILIGDLGDINAIGRRDGFELAVKGQEEFIEVVARIPTEWNQEKALAGVQSAFQANPDIGVIFTSSDFMFPSIKSVLSNLGKWKKHNEPGHVILGGFDRVEELIERGGKGAGIGVGQRGEQGRDKPLTPLVHDRDITSPHLDGHRVGHRLDQPVPIQCGHERSAFVTAR